MKNCWTKLSRNYTKNEFRIVRENELNTGGGNMAAILKKMTLCLNNRLCVPSSSWGEVGKYIYWKKDKRVKRYF